MSMLRHSRDITRFQRDRMILKRRHHPAGGFFTNIPSPNWYSKHHFSECSCLMCSGPRYMRHKTPFDWKRALVDQDYATLSKDNIQKSWW